MHDLRGWNETGRVSEYLIALYKSLQAYEMIRKRILLLVICMLLSGCRSPQANTSPSIEFSKIAKGGAGGPDKVTAKTLHFSGYEWEIRQSPSPRGGVSNYYDPANAWTDANGWLHLRISKTAATPEGWSCAEVNLQRSLGYGSYLFVVREISPLEPAAVLGLYTWDDLNSDHNHQEMDIEISRWGDPVSKNAQYVLQPDYVPVNVFRFISPAGITTHSFHWEPGRVSFRSIRGRSIGGKSISVPETGSPRVVAEHVFTSGVPSPASESVRMSFYVYGKTRTPLRNEAEVVIEKFEYLP